MITTQKLTQRYLILNLLGQGGQGSVYKAQDKRMNNRLVAIKEMSKSNLTPQQVVEATEAFEREAFLLADLIHPHLPRIYDYFKDEDTENCCLVMDFIDGKTLAEYLDDQGGKLPLKEVLDIGIQLCTVLEYLHTKQPPIIFRDLNLSQYHL